MYPRVHPRVCIILVSGSHMKASVLLGFILYRVSSIPTWFQVHDVVEDDLECLVLLPLPPSPVFSSAEGIRMSTQVWSSLSLSLCLFFCLSLSLRVSLCFSVFLEIVFGCIDQMASNFVILLPGVTDMQHHIQLHLEVICGCGVVCVWWV